MAEPKPHGTTRISSVLPNQPYAAKSIVSGGNLSFSTSSINVLNPNKGLDTKIIISEQAVVRKQYHSSLHRDKQNSAFLTVREDQWHELSKILKEISHNPIVTNAVTDVIDIRPAAIVKKDEDNVFLHEYIYTEEAKVFNELQVSAATSGVFMIVLFVALSVVSVISGVSYVHPLVTVLVVIGGLCFISMEILKKKGWN